MVNVGREQDRMLDEMSRLYAARTAVVEMCQAALADPALEPLARDILLELADHDATQ